MKPAPFEYACPRTLEEALELLGRHGDEAKVLAGGQSLVPMMNMRLARPGVVIDINRVAGLDGIVEHGPAVHVGALVRQRSLERAAAIRARAPLLAEAAPLIGHLQTRARGTVCGSVAHADPAAELPACFVALDAVYQVTGPTGQRRVAAADFQIGLFTTVLAPDELLTAIEVPALPWPHVGTAFAEVARRHGDFALAGAAAVVAQDDTGTCRVARLVFFAVGDTPHLAAATAALVGAGDDSGIDEAARAAADELDPHSDVHATGAYRRRVAAALARQTLETAWARASCR
jgi:CO/xanthine dehydrogenase FAD-binding subunit